LIYLFPLRLQLDCCLSISKCFTKLNQLQKCCSSVAGKDVNGKQKLVFWKSLYSTTGAVWCT
jgi:hypothetical protein